MIKKICLLGLLPFIGDFTGIFLSLWLVNYIKSSNLIDKNRLPIMLCEMYFMIFKDAMVILICILK